MFPTAMKVGAFESSAAVTMQARAGHGGHSLQLFTAVLGCEGFPAPVLSIFLSPSFKSGVRSLSARWGGGIAFPSAGSGALTSVMMFSAMLTRSRTQMEER